MCSFHHSVVVSGNGNDSKALHNTSTVKWCKTGFSTTKTEQKDRKNQQHKVVHMGWVWWSQVFNAVSSATLTPLSTSLVLYSQTTTPPLHPDLCSFSALGHPWSFSLMYATTRNRTIFSTVKNVSRTSCFDSENPNTKNKNKKKTITTCFLFFSVLSLTVTG